MSVLNANMHAYSALYIMQKLTIVSKQVVFDTVVANHCNITLSKETVLLLNPLGDDEHYGLTKCL